MLEMMKRLEQQEQGDGVRDSPSYAAFCPAQKPRSAVYTGVMQTARGSIASGIG